MQSASTVQLLGAGGFGALIGWYIYFINRYRTDTVQLTDVAALLTAIGGGAVLTLFPAKSELFGAYGIGLAVGFFGYFLCLLVFVLRSDEFSVNWFLDGRRTAPKPTETDGGSSGRPMSAVSGVAPTGRVRVAVSDGGASAAANDAGPQQDVVTDGHL